jgi:hypothetical protein
VYFSLRGFSCGDGGADSDLFFSRLSSLRSPLRSLLRAWRSARRRSYSSSSSSARSRSFLFS